MASITDYLEQYEKQKKAKSAPSESIGQLQAQSPFSLASAAKVNPMLEAQPNVLAQGQASAEPQVQMATPNLGTPMFEATESGRRFASGVGSIVDAGVSGAKSLMEAGGNFVNSTSDMAADLISQSTGGQVNLQSSPNVGQTSTTGVGAPITNADQLRQFMSGLNEQAAETPSTEVAEPAVETPMAEPTVQAAAPQVQESAPVEPQLQPAPQALTTGNVTTAGGQPLAEFLAGGQQLDAQGRMVDPEVDRSSFNQASADREARQAARPDFGEAVSDRDRRAASGDGMSDADRRDIAKANARGASASDIARGDKVAGLAGIDRKTGKPLTTEETPTLSVRDQIAISAEGRAQRAETNEIESAENAEIQSLNNATAAAKSLVRDVENIENVAGTAKAQADSPLTLGIGGLIMSIKPGSKASDLRANLDTLTADSAFSALSEMRASSKTGGALGAISQRELDLLGAAKRSLSAKQSDAQLIKNIDTYVNLRNKMMADARSRFVQDHGEEKAAEAFGDGKKSTAIPNDRNVASNNEALYTKYSK
jgi:hypothetical protein